MSYEIKVLGTTAEPGWQHRLGRGAYFGAWQDYDPGFEGFGVDPQTGAGIQAGVTYWLYARNLALPPEADGSDQQRLATAIVVTPEGRVESLAPDAVLCRPDGNGNDLDFSISAPYEDGQTAVFEKDLATNTYKLKNGPRSTLKTVTNSGPGAEITDTNVVARAPNANFLLDRPFGAAGNRRGVYVRDLTPNALDAYIRYFAGLTPAGEALIALNGNDRLRLTETQAFLLNLPLTTNTDLPELAYDYTTGQLFQRVPVGGTGTVKLILSNADLDLLEDFFYHKHAARETREDAPPPYPVLSGAAPSGTGGTITPTLPATVNFLDYVITAEGHLIGLLNGSNGNLFFFRLLGRSNSAWADTKFLIYEDRIGGTDANGTYQIDFGPVPGGGFTLQGRAGADAGSVKSLNIDIVINGPMAQLDFRIIDPASPARDSFFEDEVSIALKFQQKYTQGAVVTWKDFPGDQIWYIEKRGLLNQSIPGFAVAGSAGTGSYSGGSTALLTTDEPAQIRVECGVQVIWPITLKNRPTGSAPTETILIFDSKYDANGLALIVNANLLTRVRLRSNGGPSVDETIYQPANIGGKNPPEFSTYAKVYGELLAWNYRADIFKGLADTTPERTIDVLVPGITGGNLVPVGEARTFGFISSAGGSVGWSAEPTGPVTVVGTATGATVTGVSAGGVTLLAVNNGATYLKPLTVQAGSGSTPAGEVVTLGHYEQAAPRANTIELIQYRFVVNGLGAGNSNDLLEIQMYDGYAEQPMYIAPLLSTQAAPTTTNGMALFQRITQNNPSTNRNYRLAAGQNLKNKSFRVYISNSAQSGAYSTLRFVDITTTTTSTSGFVNLYTAPAP